MSQFKQAEDKVNVFNCFLHAVLWLMSKINVVVSCVKFKTKNLENLRHHSIKISFLTTKYSDKEFWSRESGNASILKIHINCL